jgi:hypothetical protein
LSIKIENQYKEGVPINIEKTVNNLLIKVPKEQLVGLDTIVIVNKVTHKRGRKADGLYWPKIGSESARIEIAIGEIYKGMPRFVFFLPFIAKFMLADVLFHEIGHHYQSFTHNLKKEEWENFATKYKKKMLKKTFLWWRLLLLPLSPLVHWLNHRAQGKKNCCISGDTTETSRREGK